MIIKKIIFLSQELLRKKSLANVFIALRELNKIYFDAYLKPDFSEQKFHYFKLFIRARKKLFRALQKMRGRNQNHPEIIEKVVRIYETIFSMHLLRFRVTDFTVFAICRQDMQSILHLMTELMQDVLRLLKRDSRSSGKSWQTTSHDLIAGKIKISQQSILISTDRLLAAIHIFETIYHQTLKIVSPDPSIFLFFIQDAYTLCDDIENMSNLLWQASKN